MNKILQVDCFGVTMPVTSQARKRELANAINVLYNNDELRPQFSFAYIQHLVALGLLSPSSAGLILSGRASSFMVQSLESFVSFVSDYFGNLPNSLILTKWLKLHPPVPDVVESISLFQSEVLDFDPGFESEKSVYLG